MFIDKKNITSNKSGFTLVELIVVITILATLGTIAFLSFNGYSASARDSKRKTDLSNIASKINVTLANGTTYVQLVSDSAAIITGNISLAGVSSALTNTQYNAGLINFNLLGVKDTDFMDPDGVNKYRIGATSLAGGSFQLAASLENDNIGNTNANALVVGNYNARLSTTTGTATGTSIGTNYTIQLPNNMTGMFKINDTISYPTAAGTMKVTNVSSDGNVLTVNTSVSGTGLVALKLSEIQGLIKDRTTNVGIVNASGATLPY